MCMLQQCLPLQPESESGPVLVILVTGSSIEFCGGFWYPEVAK